MCFSAPASFVAGIALSTVGAATIRMTSRRAEIAFAMIPLLFGVQQLTEGMSLSGLVVLANGFSDRVAKLGFAEWFFFVRTRKRKEGFWNEDLTLTNQICAQNPVCN